MKLKRFNELNEGLAPEHMEDRIKEVAQNAQEKFWEYVASEFPEITSGDFAPDATFYFDAACEKAVDIWVWGNLPYDKNER